MLYKGIIIEKGNPSHAGFNALDVKELSFKPDANYTVFRNSDLGRVIGIANLYLEPESENEPNVVLKADIDLYNDNIDGYPCITFVFKKYDSNTNKAIDCEFKTLSINTSPNSDPTIKTLKEQISNNIKDGVKLHTFHSPNAYIEANVIKEKVIEIQKSFIILNKLSNELQCKIDEIIVFLYKSNK